MADKKTIYYDDERPIVSDINRETDQWTDYGDEANTVLDIDRTGEGLPAKSYKSSGRHCARCSDRLRYKEITEEGTIVVYCPRCGKQYHTDDLNAWETDEKGNKIVDQVTDNLYRQIPDDLVNYYMAFFEKAKGKV